MQAAYEVRPDEARATGDEDEVGIAASRVQCGDSKPSCRCGTIRARMPETIVSVRRARATALGRQGRERNKPVAL
jgi:hypothetical protein